MKRRFGSTDLVLLQGDLTRQEVDAVVNAANSLLSGGGGVDGAIHAAGGPKIMEECRRIVARHGRLGVGEAVITTGGDLPAKYVIHTVGPVWYGGANREPELLADAYRNSLAVAEREGVATVAFPAISAGAFGYPVGDAARVSLAALAAHLRSGSALREVRVVIYDPKNLAAWERAFSALPE
jgi:O-acetyl-ADP-ribose deacetylase (regulator of RNase III)